MPLARPLYGASSSFLRFFALATLTWRCTHSSSRLAAGQERLNRSKGATFGDDVALSITASISDFSTVGSSVAMGRAAAIDSSSI